MEELGGAFDVVVLGTGLPEAILAAAATRADFSVLHLDRNDYYGGPWASFNLNGLADWAQKDPPVDDASDQDLQALLADGETLHKCPPPCGPKPKPPTWHVDRYSPPVEPETASEVSEVSETSAEHCGDGDGSGAEVEGAGEETTPPPPETPPETRVERLGRLRVAAEEEFRRFSLDLAPKGNGDACVHVAKKAQALDWILFDFNQLLAAFRKRQALLSRGPMVELLITSGVHRYAEFVIADRILTHLDGAFHSVPISRSDVFQSTEVSMMEKRKLMKFLTTVINTTPSEDVESDATFRDFLDSSDLTPLLRHYIFSAIVMADQTTTASQGLVRIREFLGSVGRFGNSPYLFTLYGSGEMPQFFCRLCAVFGGTYCLSRPVQAILTTPGPEGPRVSGVVTGGQRIECRWLVADASYLPASLATATTATLPRAILLSHGSLLPNAPEDRKGHISLLNWCEGGKSVRCLELPSSSMCTPKDVYACQLTLTGGEMEESVEDTFKPFVDKFFGEDDGRPSVLWSLYYEQAAGAPTLVPGAPSNLILTPPPSPNFTYHDLVSLVKAEFERLWPESEFLPPVPEVEEEERMFEVSNGFRREEDSQSSPPDHAPPASPSDQSPEGETPPPEQSPPGHHPESTES